MGQSKTEKIKVDLVPVLATLETLAENTERIKDANQVKTVVKRLHALDVKGELGQIMSIPSKLKGSECTHEGWILGAVN